MTKTPGFLYVALILATACGAFGQAPASPSAGGNAAQAVTAPKNIQAGMDRLTTALRSADPQARQEALAILRLVHQAYTEEILRLQQDSDAEVRLRLTAARDVLVQNLREAWILGHLDLPMRKALQSAQTDAPEFCRQIMTGAAEKALASFNADTGQVASGAFGGGGSEGEPPKLTPKQMEAVFFLALHDSNPSVRRAGMRAIAGSGVKSQSLAGIAADLFAEGLRNQQPGRYMGTVEPSLPLSVAATGNTPLIAGKLMAMYLAQPHNVAGLDVMLVEAAAKTGELGIIPILLDRLKNTDESAASAGADGPITRAQSDPALDALIILTGQQIKDYNMVRSDAVPGSFCSLGFKDAQARAAAIKKFMNWWDQHKDQAPFKNLKQLEIPKSPASPVELWEQP